MEGGTWGWRRCRSSEIVRKLEKQNWWGLDESRNGEKIQREGKQELVKWRTGISVSFVEFVFVGSGVNGLMCLRTLGPVWTVSLGRTSRSRRRTRYLELTGPDAHSSPLSCPDVPEYVMTSWREKRQRWIERERERERRRDYFVSSLVLFVGLNGPGNT